MHEDLRTGIGDLHILQNSDVLQQIMGNIRCSAYWIIPFFLYRTLDIKEQKLPVVYSWLFNSVKEGGEEWIACLYLNDSLMPNTILTLMYNIFKVKEETLYKPWSVQSAGLGFVSIVNSE